MAGRASLDRPLPIRLQQQIKPSTTTERTTTMKKLILTLAVAAIAASAHAGDLPANYKAVALAAVKSQLRDPGSVQHLALVPTPPFAHTGPYGPQGTCVTCVVNAKNGFGGYSGDRPAWVTFKDGRVVNVVIMSSF
jgi:hypothetical protein